MANCVLGIWLWFASGDIQNWLNATTLWRIEHLAGVMLSSGVIYLAVLWLTGMRVKHVWMVPATDDRRAVRAYQ